MNDNQLDRCLRSIGKMCFVENYHLFANFHIQHEEAVEVQQASNIAIRSHHSEKLKALRNVVTNTVLIENYEESKKMIFLRVIDEMTPLHFRLLDFLIYSNVILPF